MKESGEELGPTNQMNGPKRVKGLLNGQVTKVTVFSLWLSMICASTSAEFRFAESTTITNTLHSKLGTSMEHFR